MTTSDRRCVGRTRRGRCTIRANLRVGEDGRPLCIWHDPERKATASRMRRKGGRRHQLKELRRAQRVPPPPVTLDDAVRYASWITHAVATGALDARKGQIVVKAIEAFNRSFALAGKVRELEATVRELKKRLAKEAP